MAKKKKGRRSFTLPIAAVAPVIASPFIPPGPSGWGAPIEGLKKGQFDEFFRTFICSWTFYDPGKTGVSPGGFKMDGGNALKVTLVGLAVHWLASKLGLNRALGRAKVPIFRI